MFKKFNNFLFLDFVGEKIYSYLIKYPTPINLNYMWNFGSMAGIFLVIQILSGFFLTMFYVPHIDYAFNSIEHIMRDVNYGWLIRYIHSNGASFFSCSLYSYIKRIILWLLSISKTFSLV